MRTENKISMHLPTSQAGVIETRNPNEFLSLILGD